MLSTSMPDSEALPVVSAASTVIKQQQQQTQQHPHQHQQNISPSASTASVSSNNADNLIFQEQISPNATNFYNSPSLSHISTTYSPVDLSLQNHNSQHPQQSIINDSHFLMPHKSSRRFARIFLFLLFITTILFFFLSFDCWPALSSLFDIRRASSLNSDNTCYKSSIFRNRTPKPFPIAISHGQSHHSNSLLARPLKHLSSSFSLARLSSDKITALLKKNNSTNISTSGECESRTFWRTHQRETTENRVSRLRSLCNLYDFDGKIFTYRTKSSNRAKNNNTTNNSQYSTCSTHTCPLLINTHERVLACFIQKTASTSLKTLFLKLDNNNETRVETSANLTVFHNRANDELHRISPVSLLGNSVTNSYTKALFVRHPFVRLVSAFKDKAEAGPEEEPFFWTQYWRPLLDKIHGKNRDPEMKLKFEEFVDNYLLITDPYIWDEHWAPIWTRCEPCFVRYNLIGKLETSDRDFRILSGMISQHPNQRTYLMSDNMKSNQTETGIWKNRNNKFGENSQNISPCNHLASKYAETRKYLSKLSTDSIIELYKKFYLDFELFGYTLEELFA